MHYRKTKSQQKKEERERIEREGKEKFYDGPK